MNRQIVLILASAFFLFALWKSCSNKHAAELQARSETESAPAARPEVQVSEAPPPAAVDASADQPPPSTAPLDAEQIRARYAGAITDAGNCLDLPMNGGDKADPTIDNWVAAIKPELGEPVLQSEDRLVTNLITPSGEGRQIRVEMDYSGENRVVRRTTYYRYSTPGTPPEQIPLSAEQAESPTDTFLASLEADGRVNLREKSQRIYFAGGEEVVVTERNGLVYEIEMNRNGRSFHCKPADPNPEACGCH